MEFNKLVALTKRRTKYAQACGKRSILDTKPISKINPSKLGICFPNGSIRFQTEKSALNYSKNACLTSSKLAPSQQYEIGVLRNENTILGVVDGTHNHVDMSKCGLTFHQRSKNRTLSIEHYHPDLYGKGRTNPISIGSIEGDLVVLDRGNLKSITAYNSLGQYNKVEILPNYQTGQINDFCSEFFYFLKNIAFSKEMQDRFALLDKIKQLSVKGNWKMSIKTQKEFRILQSEMIRTLRQYQETEEYARLVHNFLLKNAGKYGMKYSTNMIF